MKKCLTAKLESILILDDLMSQADDRVENIFTKLSHHKSVSVLFLTQNLFFKSKQARTISLNSHYIVVFKNARDAMQISNLARQMYPGNSKFMVEAFKDATSGPYGYLLIDMKPYTEEAYRLRTNIFPGRNSLCVYSQIKGLHCLVSLHSLIMPRSINKYAKKVAPAP